MQIRRTIKSSRRACKSLRPWSPNRTSSAVFFTTSLPTELLDFKHLGGSSCSFISCHMSWLTFSARLPLFKSLFASALLSAVNLVQWPPCLRMHAQLHGVTQLFWQPEPLHLTRFFSRSPLSWQSCVIFINKAVGGRPTERPPMGHWVSSSSDNSPSNPSLASKLLSASELLLTCFLGAMDFGWEMVGQDQHSLLI